MSLTAASEISANLPFSVDETVLEQVAEFLQNHASEESGPPDEAPPIALPPEAPFSVIKSS